MSDSRLSLSALLNTSDDAMNDDLNNSNASTVTARSDSPRGGASGGT